jgi:ABC-2 type transport system permease protein
MIGTGIWNSCFQNLAISIPLERDSGALKRLYGTPMPKSAYFVGKILLVGFLSLIEIVGLLAMGVAFYGVSFPPVSRLPTLAWVLVLGVSACTLLGLAVAGLMRNGRTAGAVVATRRDRHTVHLGVYFVFSELPPWLQAIGSLFPLRWLTLGTALGVPPRQLRGHRVGRVLAARDDRAGPAYLVRRRVGRVVAHVPLDVRTGALSTR